MPWLISTASSNKGMNCRVRDAQTESYLFATRSQPSCSNRVKGSFVLLIEGEQSAPSLEDRLSTIFVPGDQLIFRHHAGTGVPAEQRVVVARWSDFFRLLKLPHRLAQFVIGVMTGAGMTLREFRLRPALGPHAGVLGRFVFPLI